MKVYIGSDHQGFYLSEVVETWLEKEGYDVERIGERVLDPKDDYPQIAQQAAMKVLTSDERDPRAILICENGQGMAIAANRFKGIRAAVVWDTAEAESSRIDNDSNILSLPSRVLDGDINNVKNIVTSWLDTKFSRAARHIRRNQELDNI